MDVIAIADLQYWGATLALVTAALVLWSRLGVNKIAKKCWDSTLGRGSCQHIETQEQMALIIEALSDIQGHILPNGGGAIPDALERIEDRQRVQIAKSNASRYAAKEATFATDVNGSCTEVNRAHSRLTGLSESELLEDGWINSIAPSERIWVQSRWEKAVEDGREFSEDILYIRPSGREFMVHVTAYKQLDDEGKLHGFHGVVTPLEVRS